MTKDAQLMFGGGILEAGICSIIPSDAGFKWSFKSEKGYVYEALSPLSTENMALDDFELWGGILPEPDLFSEAI